MFRYSLWLTIVVALVIGVMFKITGSFGGRSAKFMVAQQKSLAKEEGFIEEMMEGMKVVKVFTHEEEAKKKFDEVNDQLFDDSNRANANANMLMPILAIVCGAMGDKLAPIGGTGTVLIGVAIAASSAMILPISTPPNALAFATGYVKQNDMAKVGTIMGIISMVLGFGLVYLMGTLKLI